MIRFDAVKTPLEGTNLIEASAGTGKTFAISMIYLRLLVEKRLRIEQILVVTFTLPATMELRLRIRNVIQDALRFCESENIKEAKEPIITEIIKPHKKDPAVVQSLRSALKSFDEASVYTIHSFCQQVLADNAFESGALFSSDIATDGAVNERICADFWRREVYSLPEDLAAYIIHNESPHSLLKLYKKRPLSPGLKIEPPTGEIDTVYLSGLVESLRHAYESFRETWDLQREEVIKFFLGPDNPGGVSYKPKDFNGRLDAVDEYVKNGDFFILPDKLKFFTKEKLMSTGKVIPEYRLFDKVQELYDAFDTYNSAFSGFLNAFKVKMFHYIDKESSRLKGESGTRGFDDLIKDVQAALNREHGLSLAESVRGRYRAALIDEFQDTDDLQFNIFSRIFGNGGSILFLIGDPKQAIYRFRGADIFSYIKASDMVKNKFTLANNFRSTPELISGINAIFSGSPAPFIFKEIVFTPVDPGKPDQGKYIYKSGDKIKAVNIGLADYSIANSNEDDNDSMILRQLAGEISEMVGSGEYKFMPGGNPVAPSDIAVLVRSHAHAAAVQETLARYGIPSVARGHESVFATTEASELCRILQAVAEPGRSGRVRSAAATSIMGYDARFLYMLHNESSDGAELLEKITERFHGYRDTWVRSGFMDMFTILLSDEKITVRILGQSRGERAMANINHLAEALNIIQFENSFSPEELVSWIEDAILTSPEGDEYAVRLDKDSDAVNVVTMHACKGLEYPVVFCPYLTYSWQPPENIVIYHDPYNGNNPVLCLDKESASKEINERKKLEDLAENVRLMYVALTRAKSMCRILFMIKERGFKDSAPFHLLLKEKVPEKAKAAECYGPFINVLADLASGSDGNIEFSVIKGDKGKIYRGTISAGPELHNRIFNGEIRRSWGMQSYSSITQVSADEKSDGYTGSPISEGTGIFAFPRGAKAGLCLHEIFETSDFGETDGDIMSERVLSVLKSYGFDESWVPCVTEMFFNVTGSILPGCGGISLRDIGTGNRLSEMEFNFPLGEFSVTGLREIFSNAPLYGRAVYERLGRDDTKLRGMMKGFVDLVFRAGEKYYIADWKSNALGIRSDDYNMGRMEAEMLHHNYHLQYYLYTVALHRYLSLRLGDSYSYSKNFGGVYYFFVRGMTGGDKSPGIFHVVPDGETVLMLDRFFRGEDAK